MFIRLIIVIAFIITAGLVIPGFANPDVKHTSEPPLSAYMVRTSVDDSPKPTEGGANKNVTPEISGDDNVHQ